MGEQIPVVYILSNGHSGTTLLDLLLGAHPHVWTLGEAQLLPWELRNPRAPCGSGEPIQESVFWRDLLDDIPTEPTGYHVGYFRDENQSGRVLRWNLLPDVLRGRVSELWEGAVEEYGRNNARYFQVARRAAERRSDREIRWLIDASMDPYRLFWLRQSDRFDIRVIHAIKDPRSFVYSMTKHELPWKANRVIRFTGRWIIENALMAHVCHTQFSGTEVRRQRYETLATDPKETMVSIGDWLGLDYAPELVDTFREYENFAISGNMMRWRASDEDIELDERWKRHLPEVYKALISQVTAPFKTVCGYEGP
jgi:peptidoglycan/xylan/chitin deacetylase (PgdA/CDA1 family)